MTVADFARRLEARKTAAGWEAKCPAHPDERASLSITAGDDGRVLGHCHAGCKIEDVVAAAGLRMSDLMPKKARAGRGNVVAVYDYKDETGELLYQKQRYEPKGFAQRRPDGAGGWTYKLGDVPRVLYRVRELRAAITDSAEVFLCEGEKDVDNLAKLGLIATTNCEGAGKWQPAYTEALKGAIRVTIIADRDAPGRAHAARVASELRAAGVNTRVVEVPGDGFKDASDWIAADAARKDFEQLAHEAFEREEDAAPPQRGSTDGADSRPEPSPIDDEDSPRAATGGEPTSKRGPSKSAELIRLALGRGTKPFNSGDGRAFALLQTGRVLPLRSREFRGFLESLFWSAKQTSAGGETINDTVNHFESVALYEAETRSVYVRVAPLGSEGVCLDIGGPNLSCVEITAQGWRVVDRPRVFFIRPGGMLPLPPPASGGSLNQLRPFLNLGEGDEANHRWALVSTYLVSSLHPAGPYPGLAIGGEQGSGKSHAARLIRAVLDPSKPLLRTVPRDERDLAIAASRSWLVAIDNVSALSASTSDALCRVATGGGLATRTLYTDGDETIFDFKRPILLNGIDPAFRPDLMDRLLLVVLPTIRVGARRLESEVDAGFRQHHAQILGGLLDAVVMALRNVADTDLVGDVRMADAARWAVAAEPALGVASGAVQEALRGNKRDATEVALEGSPIVPGLREVELPWTGTPTDLLKVLNAQFGDKLGRPERWPKTAQALSGELMRIAPNLRDASVCNVVRPPGRGKGRRIELHPVDATPVDVIGRPPRPSASPPNEEKDRNEDAIEDEGIYPTPASSSYPESLTGRNQTFEDEEDEEDGYRPAPGEEGASFPPSPIPSGAEDPAVTGEDL